jgi:ParB family chromosome partitioning protein
MGEKMQKKVLGRGLESLIPSLGIDKISTREIVVTISLDKIKPNRFQPRVEFNTESIYELADSIKKYGLVQPILISESIVPGEYEIIAGERRYMASKFAGKKDIKAIVRHFVNTSQRFAMALIENIQREDLNPIEEANAFKKLMEEFGHTHEQISEIVGKNRSVISNTL